MTTKKPLIEQQRKREKRVGGKADNGADEVELRTGTRANTGQSARCVEEQKKKKRAAVVLERKAAEKKRERTVNFKAL